MAQQYIRHKYTVMQTTVKYYLSKVIYVFGEDCLILSMFLQLEFQ